MKKLKTGVTTTEENGQIIVNSPYFKEECYYTRQSQCNAGKAFLIAFIGLVVLVIIDLIFY